MKFKSMLDFSCLEVPDDDIGRETWETCLSTDNEPPVVGYLDAYNYMNDYMKLCCHGPSGKFVFVIGYV